MQNKELAALGLLSRLLQPGVTSEALHTLTKAPIGVCGAAIRLAREHRREEESKDFNMMYDCMLGEAHQKTSIKFSKISNSQEPKMTTI